MRLSLDTIHDHRPSDPAPSPKAADPYTVWLKMLVFGAAVAALAFALSASWGSIQFSARTRGEPSRRTLGLYYPYVMLAICAFKWMGIWALTSSSPLLESLPAHPKRHAFLSRRTGLLRLLVTASFILLSLRMWGIIGEGLRPVFNGSSFGLVTDCLEAIETVLLWSYLPAMASSAGIDPLRAWSLVVMIGRAGSMIALIIASSVLLMERRPMTILWEFGNFRIAMAMFWDAAATLVLGKFAIALFRNCDPAPR